MNGQFDQRAQKSIQDFVDAKNRENRQRTTDFGLYLTLLPGEIRILELLPGVSGAALEGRLHIVGVDFAHELRKDDSFSFRRHTNHAISVATGKAVWYTTLSYTWGAPVFDQSIRFESNVVNITSSLARALHRLRSPSDGHFLWIDQLCIDQSSNAEKVMQIPLMDQIYTKATNTVIWLGDDDGEDPLLAFETMQTVYGRLQMSDVVITPADFARLEFPPVEDPAWQAIRRIFKRPWFTRLWTIQEAILSRELFVKCGEAVACWDDIAAWCYVLEQSHLLRWLDSLDDAETSSQAQLPSGKQLSGAHVLNSLQADRIQSLTHEGKEYLLSSLVRTRYAQATNPKDKVYGVLGLAESSLIPDYRETTPARDIYHEACVTQLPHLVYELLSCVDHDEPLKPSWVPDWSAARKTEALGYSTKAWTLYHAGGIEGPDPIAGPRTHKSPLLSTDLRYLTLNGLVFDRIMHLGPVSETPSLSIISPESSNTDLLACVELISKAHTNDPNPNTITSIFDDLLQTLVAGRDSTGTAPITSEHSEVFSLILDSTTGKMPSLSGQTYSPRRQKGFFTLKNLETRKPAKILEDLESAMRSALTMRRFAITERGCLALVPRGSKEGDYLVVYEKACVPFVIRRTGEMVLIDTESSEMEIRRNLKVERLANELIGEAYVHGVMQGQLLETPGFEFEDVVLM